MNWTDDKLKALSVVERANLRANASRSKASGAAALVLQIDALGLPSSTGGLSKDDPIYVEMEEVIRSDKARATAIEAVAEGRPAFAGVDLLLQRAMGPRYSAANQGTMTAGSIMAEVMRSAGYEIVGREDLPEGCVAKSAVKWKPNKPLPKA